MRILFFLLYCLILLIPVGEARSFPVEQEYAAGLQRKLLEIPAGECRYNYTLLDNCFLWLDPDEFLDWRKILATDFPLARRLHFTAFDYPFWMSISSDQLLNDSLFSPVNLFSDKGFSVNTEIIFGRPDPFQGSSTASLLFDPVTVNWDSAPPTSWSGIREEPFAPLTVEHTMYTNSALTTDNGRMRLELPDYQPGGVIQLQTAVFVGVPVLVLLGGLFRIIRLPNALLLIICWFSLIELYKMLHYFFTVFFD